MEFDTDEKPQVKVVDKRRFNEDGETKEGVLVNDPGGEEQGGAEQKGAQQDVKPEPSAADADFPEVDLSSFIVSLATQALAVMGELPGPEFQEVEENIPAAKNLIDVLGILEEKTKGNLTESEEKLLRDILSSVRLAYVSKLNKLGNK